MVATWVSGNGCCLVLEPRLLCSLFLFMRLVYIQNPVIINPPPTQKIINQQNQMESLPKRATNIYLVLQSIKAPYGVVHFPYIYIYIIKYNVHINYISINWSATPPPPLVLGTISAFEFELFNMWVNSLGNCKMQPNAATQLAKHPPP